MEVAAAQLWLARGSGWHTPAPALVRQRTEPRHTGKGVGGGGHRDPFTGGCAAVLGCWGRDGAHRSQACELCAGQGMALCDFMGKLQPDGTSSWHGMGAAGRGQRVEPGCCNWG